MNAHTSMIIAAAWLMFSGWWKIPSIQSELRNPLAPYRALAGTLQVLIGVLMWLVWMVTGGTA